MLQTKQFLLLIIQTFLVTLLRKVRPSICNNALRPKISFQIHLLSLTKVMV